MKSCPKCGGEAKAEPHQLLSDPPYQPYYCTSPLCRHHWLERVGGSLEARLTQSTPLNDVKIDLKDALEILEEDTECDCPPEWPRCVRCRVRHRVRRALRLLEEAKWT